METSARTAIVGFFTVVVAVAGFLFVYWLHNPGGVGRQALYTVRFESSVIGLRPGVAVLFNGLRVGEVRRMALDASHPRAVSALIAVDPATPVREDTKVGIDALGLMGSTVISLSGGSSAQAPPSGAHGEPPLLVAEAGATETLSQAARNSLGKIDAILGDNAAPLHDAIANIDTFSAALARNSARVDAILAGLEKMTGGAAATAPPFSYDLPVPNIPSAKKPSNAQIAVADPTGMIVFDTQKILVSKKPDQRSPLDNGQWSDTIPKLVQQKIAQSLEKAGFQHVAKATDGFSSDVQVMLDIRAFEFSLAPSPVAHVEIAAKILDSHGKIVAAQSFGATAPGTGDDAKAATAAIGRAFGMVVLDLVAWTRDAL
jgi:phospholipid/cholesterol/gamma-HCH transport system substrate-binding protein